MADDNTPKYPGMRPPDPLSAIPGRRPADPLAAIPGARPADPLSAIPGARPPDPLSAIPGQRPAWADPRNARSPGGAQGSAGSEPTAALSGAMSLPSGGGALRSLGESFSSNQFTGAGSMIIPIPAAAGRSGFGPELALGYSTGAGNGPFGLGWQLGVPTISRKTSKGVPEYRDGAAVRERDTFMLAGADDLVHELDDEGQPWTTTREDHRVERFRPRVEGAFTRLERWTGPAGEVHWRTITSDNLTSVYGRSPAARIADPSDHRRVFSWLLEERRDDRGNVIAYEYKQEDLAGVDTAAPHERPRLAETPEQAQRYLKRIRYGNATPFEAGGWHFEIVFDYGEHGTTHGEQHEVSPAELRPWAGRPDTFSSFRAGFELRTRRLCRRVLVFHHFVDELGPEPVLVSSTDLHYDEQPALTRLVGVTQRSYRRDEQSGHLDSAALPTLELDYSEGPLGEELHEVDDPQTLRNLPAGIDGRQHRLVDLDGEGLPGVLIEQGGAWHYKRGLGDGRFGPMRRLPARPSTQGLAGVRLVDLDGDGRKELVSFGPPTPGYFRRTDDDGWANFRAFSSIPNVDWSDPRAQLIDLSGDGFPDLLLDRGDRFEWFRSKGAEGFERPRVVPKAKDEGGRPVVMFADARVSIQFADMSGDGLPDLVRIKNGQVAYWPSLGHGRFGPMIRMAGLEAFAAADSFDPGRLRLADVDGTGPTDLVYLGDRGATVYRNLAGNRFAPGETIARFPSVRGADWAEVVDLCGTGTASLVWSTSLSSGRGGRLRYLELTSGRKPHLLIAARNNMGAETRIRYAPSTSFYLRDKAAGRPWLTKLPFPVHVVERVEHLDHVTRQRHVERFAYHYGDFDGVERELRGFGLVERWDSERFEDFASSGLFELEEFDPGPGELHQPPVYTKTWFHTGAFVAGGLGQRFTAEYWAGDPKAPRAPSCELPPGSSGAERREAARALAGMTLRVEVYALDGTPAEVRPYSVSETGLRVRQVQPAGPNRFGVYLAHGRESIAAHYERVADDPRVTHGFTLEVDPYGVVLRSAEVAYPRRAPELPEQAVTHVTLDERDVVHLDALDDALRLGVSVETRAWELRGLELGEAGQLDEAQLRAALDGAPAVGFEAPPSEGLDRRLLARARTRYLADDLSAPLPHGAVESMALLHETRTMAMSAAQFDAVFGELEGAPSPAELVDEGGYLLEDGAWWIRSGQPTYAPEAFFAVVARTDPFGNVETVTHDAHALLELSRTDALGNTVSVDHDYRLLAPWQRTDENGNRQQVAFDLLGLVERVAVMGKLGEGEGDSLEDPTCTFEYDLHSWRITGAPNWARTRARERHQDPDTPWLERRTYFGGGGQAIMTKAQARPGLAPQRDAEGQLILDDEGQPVLADTGPQLRWIGTGRVVRDNKGNVVKAYEPYYSSTPAFEAEAELVEQGVTAVNVYDPLGRLVRTQRPDGTFSKVEFGPWRETSWDPQDTVLQSSWYVERIDYEGDDPGLAKERRAAKLAAAHADTPSVTQLDSLGRAVVSVAHNLDEEGDDEFLTTRHVLDVQGDLLELIDPRGNTAEARIHGMLGQPLRVSSVDAGARWYLHDAQGQLLRGWGSRGQRFTLAYDALRRPTARSVSVDGGPQTLLARVVYGEQLDEPAAANHRGRVFRRYDGAGVATTLAYDFTGRPIAEQRQLVADGASVVDWSPLSGAATIAQMAAAAAPLLDDEVFSASSQHDALGRVLTAVSPDGSEQRYGYDEGGRLRTVELDHRGAGVVEAVVGDIRYDAKGQREALVRGPVDAPTATTRYGYDPQTYRLRRLATIRGQDQARLQDLHYHYDAAGNVTDIRDAAQQTVYFQNAVVEAANSYRYDATYRLVEASGREHASQGTGQRTHEQLPVGPQPMASDPAAMRRYTQRYRYDAAGNLLELRHIAAGGAGWTRRYRYAEGGDHLLETSAPGDDPQGPYSHVYEHDAHGNMVAMPHLAAMTWDVDDQLVGAQAGTAAVHFQYADGVRARKFTETAGATTEERIYLGAFELYRKRVGGELVLERESLHVSDDGGRICLVETKTVADGEALAELKVIWRHQLDNHLGSAITELTQAGAVISHEEFHPYGTSAYRAVDAAIDVSPKRYRYTGMERDDETGLAYHSARYLAPWLGRWIAADPLGVEPGLNRYRYASNAPVCTRDPSGTETPEERLASVNARIRQAERERGGIEQELQRAFAEQDLAGVERAQQRLHQHDARLGGLRERRADLVAEADELRHAEMKAELALQSARNFSAKLRRDASDLSDTLDLTQAGLDGLSITLDATGIGATVSWAPDVVNAGISVGRGDWVGAGLSVLAAVPFIGIAANAKRLGRHVDEVGEAGVRTSRQAKAEALRAKRAKQLRANKKKGKAYEAEVGKELRGAHTDVVEQVTLKTKSGTRTRVDFMSHDEAGNIVVTEAKSSQTAPLTRNQSRAFPEIQESGAVIAGKGKPPFVGGTELDPTQVKIKRKQ